MSSVRQRTPELLLRFAAAAAAVLFLGALSERTLATAAAPILQRLLSTFGESYIFLDVGVAHAGPNETLQTRADFSRPVTINGRSLEPFNGRGWLQVNQTLGGIFAYSELLLIMLLAWPAAQWTEYGWRLLPGLSLACALAVLNVVSTTLAELWASVHQELDPASFSPLLAWSRFLMGGGGWVLALLSAVLVIRCCAWRRPPVTSSSFSRHLTSASSAAPSLGSQRHAGHS